MSTLFRTLVTDRVIVCVTSAVAEPVNMTQLIVTFDGNQKQIDHTYHYTPDPNITDIFPRASYAR